jgi:hypothetical protein
MMIATTTRAASTAAAAAPFFFFVVGVAGGGDNSEGTEVFGPGLELLSPGGAVLAAVAKVGPSPPVMDVVVLVVGHAPSPGRQSVGPMQTLPSLTVGMSTV